MASMRCAAWEGIQLSRSLGLAGKCVSVSVSIDKIPKRNVFALEEHQLWGVVSDKHMFSTWERETGVPRRRHRDLPITASAR